MGTADKAAFNAATQLLIDQGITLKRLAEVFSVSLNTAWRWRSEKDPQRGPPDGWRATLADFAGEHARTMADLAEKIRRGK